MIKMKGNLQQRLKQILINLRIVKNRSLLFKLPFYLSYRFVETFNCLVLYNCATFTLKKKGS